MAIATPDWPSFCDGGVATVAHTLASGLQRVGADVQVWTRGGGARERSLVDSAPPGVVVRGVPGRSWRRLGGWHWRRGLPSLVRDFAPDAVVASPWQVLEGLRGVPAAVRVFGHGRELVCPLPGREDARSRLLKGRSFFVFSQWLRERLVSRGASAARVSVVPAAVPEAAEVRGAAAPTVLVLGRLVRRKGQDVAIHAAGRLRRRFPDLRVRVVGQGQDGPRLTALVDRLGLRETVSLEGFVPGESAWQGAHVLLLPTRQEPDDVEGFGLVFREAEARGVPSVAGRVGGVAEAVEHGRSGLLLDDPTNVDAVADTVASLLSDPVRRAAMGRWGRQRHAREGLPEHLGRAVLDAFAADRAKT